MGTKRQGPSSAHWTWCGLGRGRGWEQSLPGKPQAWGSAAAGPPPRKSCPIPQPSRSESHTTVHCDSQACSLDPFALSPAPAWLCAVSCSRGCCYPLCSVVLVPQNTPITTFTITITTKPLPPRPSPAPSQLPQPSLPSFPPGYNCMRGLRTQSAEGQRATLRPSPSFQVQPSLYPHPNTFPISMTSKSLHQGCQRRTKRQACTRCP